MPIFLQTDNQKVVVSVQQFLDSWNNDSEWISTQTSGSTGEPKTIRLRKKDMLTSAKATCDFLNLTPNNSALLCLPISTIGGKMMIVRALARNLHLTIVEPSATPLKDLSSHFDFCAMVPYQAKNSLQDIDKIKKLIIGGAPSSESLQKKIIQTRCEAYQTFGMTETISHFALAKFSTEKLVYKTLPGVTVESKNENLIVDYPAIGVHRLQTNDSVKILNQKEFIWLGRTDFVVNSGGIKLHPESIEDKLSEIISPPFFLTGVVDEKWGEKLVLCVELPQKKPFKKSSFTVLAPYESPKEVWFFSSFSTTRSKKINRLKTLENKPYAVEIL